MNDKSIKMWKLAVLLLLLCNTGLMYTMWRPAPPHGGADGETPREFVIRKLELTTAQIHQYDVLIEHHQADMRRLRDAARANRTQLFATLGNAVPADSLTLPLALTQQQIELSTYHHFRELSALCTPQQQLKLQNIINEVTGRMNGPQRPHHQNRDRNGPPPHQDNNPDDRRENP